MSGNIPVERDDRKEPRGNRLAEDILVQIDDTTKPGTNRWQSRIW